MASYFKLKLYSSCIVCILLPILPPIHTFGESCSDYYCQINCAEQWPGYGPEFEECRQNQIDCSCFSAGEGVVSGDIGAILVSVGIFVMVVGGLWLCLCIRKCKHNNEEQSSNLATDGADVFPANFPELEPVDLTRPVNYLRAIRLVEREPVGQSDLPPRYENSVTIKIPNEDEEDSPPDYKSLYI